MKLEFKTLEKHSQKKSKTVIGILTTCL